MPDTPSFLVIGNAVTETVTRTEDRAVRAHAGGVGAIMARELALAGADVTLLTTALPGPALDDVREHLAAAGVTLDADTGNPPQRMHGQVNIRCRRGEFAGASGEWVRMGGLGPRIAQIAPDYDMTLVSMNPMLTDLQIALKRSRRLIANATSPKLATRLLKMKGLTAATLNSRELSAVRAKLKAEDTPRLLGAENVLLTKGARGMSLYTAETIHDIDATPVPAGTDFVGAGDAATAGLGPGHRAPSAGHRRSLRQGHTGQERPVIPVAVAITSTQTAGVPHAPPRKDRSHLRHRAHRQQDPPAATEPPHRRRRTQAPAL